MKVNIFIIGRKTNYRADAVYHDGMVTVKKGSNICIKPNISPRIGKVAEKFRMDKAIVNSEGSLLKDCEFNNVSSAAKFVMGISANGYDSWKVEKGKSLGNYLAELGLYQRKTR